RIKIGGFLFMDYAKANFGRSFIVRFDHNDNIIDNIIKIAEKEKIKCAWFWCLGAIKNAEIVCGPVETVVPPIPSYHNILETNEIVAVGNISTQDAKPALHLHCAFGRLDKTRVGCIRKSSDVYLTVECLIMEFTHIDVKRMPNPGLGINTLFFKKD
ncbi:DNA-binding protein, partial [bacterium]|nr:DNA-binding protein [bacterium]